MKKSSYIRLMQENTREAIKLVLAKICEKCSVREQCEGISVLEGNEVMYCKGFNTYPIHPKKQKKTGGRRKKK